ncbi:MAG: pyridoxamine 5'-phosphate oxidase family protein [Caulobacteraceae bacterium]
MAIVLTDEVRGHVNGALISGNPLILAAVDAAGRPRLSFRGSTQVFSDDQLGFWARNAEGSTMAAIKANPHVALMYRDGARRVFLQFAGRARVASGAERDRVYDLAPEFERKQDPEKNGVAVVIDLDKVEGLLGFDPEGKPRRLSLQRS